MCSSTSLAPFRPSPDPVTKVNVDKGPGTPGVPNWHSLRGIILGFFSPVLHPVSEVLPRTAGPRPCRSWDVSARVAWRPWLDPGGAEFAGTRTPRGSGVLLGTFEVVGVAKEQNVGFQRYCHCRAPSMHSSMRVIM